MPCLVLSIIERLCILGNKRLLNKQQVLGSCDFLSLGKMRICQIRMTEIKQYCAVSDITCQWHIQHGCYWCFRNRNIGTIYYCHRPLAPAILRQSFTVSTRNSIVLNTPLNRYTTGGPRLVRFQLVRSPALCWIIGAESRIFLVWLGRPF